MVGNPTLTKSYPTEGLPVPYSQFIQPFISSFFRSFIRKGLHKAHDRKISHLVSSHNPGSCSASIMKEDDLVSPLRQEPSHHKSRLSGESASK
jgi:hypothetical protein